MTLTYKIVCFDNRKSTYSKSEHFYFGEIRHFYFWLTNQLRVRDFMLNIKFYMRKKFNIIEVLVIIPIIAKKVLWIPCNEMYQRY